MKNKTIYTVGLTIYILFFPLFWIAKKWSRFVFDKRKDNAIKDAVKRNKIENKHIHVVQIEKSFIVGTREELRRYDKTGCKVVKKLTGSHLLDFDFRNAIVFTAK